MSHFEVKRRGALALVVGLALVWACLAAVLVPAAAWAQGHGASLVVSQRYSSDVSGGPRTLAYELVATSPGAPLPQGAQGDTYTFTMTGSQTTRLNLSLEPSDIGSTYLLRQVVPEEVPEGLTLDDSTYQARLCALDHAQDGGDDAALVVYDAAGDKVGQVEWDVSYVAPSQKADAGSGAASAAADAGAGTSEADAGVQGATAAQPGGLASTGDSGWALALAPALAVAGAGFLGLRRRVRQGQQPAEGASDGLR